MTAPSNEFTAQIKVLIGFVNKTAYIVAPKGIITETKFSTRWTEKLSRTIGVLLPLFLRTGFRQKGPFPREDVAD